MKTRLTVSETRNAGFGDFVAVSIIRDGKEYGCDAHFDSSDDAGDHEIIDWPDGNGLIANGFATESAVWEAITNANYNAIGDALKLSNKAWPRRNEANELQTVVTVGEGAAPDSSVVGGVRFRCRNAEVAAQIRDAYEKDDATYERVVDALVDAGDAEYIG